MFIPDDDVHAMARMIVDQNPDPVTRYWLLCDAVRCKASSLARVEARAAMLESRHVAELAAAQKTDGGWGRFHTADSGAQRRIPTTEWAITRGLVLGLDMQSDIFGRAASYLVSILTGDIPFPDPAERNNRWPVGTQLFTTAALAQLQPHHAQVNRGAVLWAQIAARTFAAGHYDHAAETAAHAELTGASVRNSYLVLNHYAVVLLLGTRPDLLSKDVLHVYKEWLWSDARWFGRVQLTAPPAGDSPSPTQIDLWFTALEMFSRFPGWQTHAALAVAWLWGQRREDGLWDFGPRRNGTPHLPLAESWRRSQNRIFDHSTRVLALLRRYYAWNADAPQNVLLP